MIVLLICKDSNRLQALQTPTPRYINYFSTLKSTVVSL